MKRLHINSTLVISVLAVLSILSYLVVEKTMSYVKEDYFDIKIKAAQHTQKCFDYLKENQNENVVFIDNINDPNETGIIGQKHSHITTGSGSLPIKLSTTNANFSAMIIQLLKDADVKKEDNVVIAMTGSFPALDIATLVAVQELQANPILIVSTTSSSWGANNPDFTILDMISVLKKAGLLNINYKYASIGGNQDIGMSLSNKGRNLVLEAISRNHLELINKGDLKGNIAERLQIIENNTKGKPNKVFINIGGGVASIGSLKNKKAIPAGLHKNLKVRNIPDKQGLIYEMALKNTPIIQLANLEKLMKKYNLPRNPVPIPEIGEGKLFYSYRYNLVIVSIATFIILLAIGIFVVIDRRMNQLGDSIISDEIQI